MLAVKVVELPLRLEEEDADAATVLNDGCRDSGGRRLRRVHQPSSGRVRCRLNLGSHAVLGAEPADDHVELQGADDADDRFTAAPREDKTPA